LKHAQADLVSTLYLITDFFVVFIFVGR